MQDKIKDPLIWVDLELTGLNIKSDSILEIAVVVTSGDLTRVIEGPNIVIKCP